MLLSYRGMRLVTSHGLVLLRPTTTSKVGSVPLRIKRNSRKRTKRSSCQDFGHCSQQLSAESRFGDVTFRARRQSGCSEIKIIVQRHEHNPDLRVTLLDAMSCFDSVHLRHRNVEHAKVGFQTSDCFQERLTISHGCKYLELLLEQTYNRVAYLVMIIRYYNAGARQLELLRQEVIDSPLK